MNNNAEQKAENYLKSPGPISRE